MRKILFGLLCLVLISSIAIAEEGYQSIKLINSTDWVKYFDNALGYRYDSHGCLHFSPSDIYLLYKTIPAGIPLTVKKYKLKKNDPSFPVDKIPFLRDKIKSPQDMKKQALMFKNYKSKIVVYPSLNLFFIFVNNYPYAKVKALAGLPYNYLMAYDVQKGKPIKWDFMLSTPTDAGEYKVLRTTDHYLSSAYYKNTIVPYGAWIKKIKGRWFYQKKGKWHKLPDHIIADLARNDSERFYNYFDLHVDSQRNITAARYAGHDFGKYVLLWTKDGKNHYPEMGYTAGELLYEQIILVKDLVHLLTVAGPDDFDSVIAQNANFKYYQELSDPKKRRELLDPILSDPRVAKAYKEYKEGRLPRNKSARRKALGLYQYYHVNSLIIDKQVGWYDSFKKDWELFKKLRISLRKDFDQMGVLSIENRQNILENWLTDRLEFKSVAPPKQAKYLTDLSFSTFFRPDEETTVFSARERAIMVERIRKAVKGEAKGLNLNIVDDLNNYNLGVLLNDILGDLYKSHGCMHVSPRNSVFLYDLLPVGAQMKVYQYSKRISEEAISSVPFLADMVNFKEDLVNLKQKFAVTSEVKVAVYPYSGDWLIYIKDKAFTRLRIRGGPQSKFYLVQGRTKDGKPIFEKHLAYPTSPGDYYVYKKYDNYVSNIYHDQTVIPMGGIISKEGSSWIFQNKAGEWKKITKAVATDLKRPIDEREYTYYDLTKNPSGEVFEMKWGSQPFGRFALQTTKDRKSAWPELIHSSGDLIMEERQLVNDLIKVLTAPHDQLDECIKYSQNFDLYRICYEFTQDPKRTDLIQQKERSAYRLYFKLPLTKEELALLPKDSIIANKVLNNKKLSKDEIKVLIDEGIAYRRSGKLKINMQKIMGLQFDTYQYVVTIQKYAHHYKTLKKHWGKLSGIRRALLKDFNTFVIKDTQLFHNFMRELMLKRNDLEKLSQPGALQLLNGML
jgi:hypothetical protein